MGIPSPTSPNTGEGASSPKIWHTEWYDFAEVVSSNRPITRDLGLQHLGDVEGWNLLFLGLFIIRRAVQPDVFRSSNKS